MSPPAPIQLYEYFRSSASYRVRIGLNLKGLTYQSLPVHLTRGGGEQLGEEFKARNPAGLVPVFETGSERLTQSLAILEYLEERHPSAPLLPASSEARAFVRQIAMMISCDIHPLNNLRVLKYLTGPLELSADQRQGWIHHWMCLGLSALEELLGSSHYAGQFCCGNTPTLADCCLVPQLFSARRFEVNLSAYSSLCAIEAACQALPAFEQAHPSRQMDAE